MVLKDVYREHMNQQKKQLTEMKKLKEANKKEETKAKYDMIHYKRKGKEYTETIKQLQSSIKYYKRRLKDM